MKPSNREIVDYFITKEFDGMFEVELPEGDILYFGMDTRNYLLSVISYDHDKKQKFNFLVLKSHDTVSEGYEYVLSGELHGGLGSRSVCHLFKKIKECQHQWITDLNQNRCVRCNKTKSRTLVPVF